MAMDNLESIAKILASLEKTGLDEFQRRTAAGAGRVRTGVVVDGGPRHQACSTLSNRHQLMARLCDLA
jgi:hypothetical protein